MKIAWTSYVIIWIIISITTAFGIWVTKDPWCLITLMIPLFIGLKTIKIDDKEKKDKYEIEKD